jgi:hypothetical protein
MIQVDMSSLKCAIIVSDTLWRDASSAEESGEEHLAAADYLRLDSMVSRDRLFACICPEQGMPS